MRATSTPPDTATSKAAVDAPPAPFALEFVTRMSNRSTQKYEVAYACDETNLSIPAFLRKKVEEGKGRRQK